MEESIAGTHRRPSSKYRKVPNGLTTTGTTGTSTVLPLHKRPRHQPARLLLVLCAGAIGFSANPHSFAGEAIDQELVDAALRGDTVKATELLAKSADPKNGGTAALFSAAFSGHTETIRALLKAGVSPNATLANGYSVLLVAAGGSARLDSGDTSYTFKSLTPDRRKLLVDLLLANGANVNSTARDGTTALMVAAKEGDTDCARLLLDRNANVNAKMDNGTTALHFAAVGGHVEIVRLLLDKGADTEVKSDIVMTIMDDPVHWIRTPLESADNPNVVRLLKRARLVRWLKYAAIPVIAVPVAAVALYVGLRRRSRRPRGTPKVGRSWTPEDRPD